MAEEARVRWRAIIEAEDVPIDDISCIVVEIIQHNSTKDASADRHTPSILEKN